MSKLRFQIPSLRQFKQAKRLKQLRDNEQSRTKWNLALAAEHRRRVLKQARHRAEAFYRSILNDPNATVEEQLTARERLDKLLGLDQG